jgi:hypothetical protein
VQNAQSKNSLHNLQHDEGGNYMAETETETETETSSGNNNNNNNVIVQPHTYNGFDKCIHQHIGLE